MDKSVLNGKLISIFLFQYSLLIPMMHFINPTVVVAVSSMFIVGISVVSNINSKIDIRVLLLLAFIILITLLNSLINNVALMAFLPLYLYLLPTSLICLYRFDTFSFIKTSCYLAIVNFVVICWIPFLDFANYMRFGYGMLPTVVFLYIMIFSFRYELNLSHKSTTIILVIFCVATIEMVIYGARGSTFAFLLFLFIDRLLLKRKRIILNTSILLILIGLYSNAVELLMFVRERVSRFGIKTYALSKLIVLFQKGVVASSSGRDVLYKNAVERIREHPIVGNGIDISSGDDYVHNVFLQVAQDLGLFGLFALIIIILMIILFLIKSYNDNKNEKNIITILFVLSLGRLMFSSTLWRRPEFWLLLNCFTVYGGGMRMFSFKRLRRIDN